MTSSGDSQLVQLYAGILISLAILVVPALLLGAVVLWQSWKQHKQAKIDAKVLSLRDRVERKKVA